MSANQHVSDLHPEKVCEAVNLRCQCTLGHTQMMGRGQALKRMQNYEPDLVRRLGDAIYESMGEIWRKRGTAELMALELVEHSNEEMQYLEQNKELGEDWWSRGFEVSCTPAQTARTSQWSQTGSGCKDTPTCPTSTCRWLDDTDAHSALPKHSQRQCGLPRFTRHPISTILWPSTPSMWSGTKRRKQSSPSWTSSAGTRSTVKSKMRQPKWSLHCLTPHGAKSFGYPKIIRMDASGPHQGELFAEWASNHGIKVNLIPRGAHHRLGILEREPCREKKDAGNFQGRSSNLQLRTSAAGDGTSEEQTEFKSRAQRQPLWHLAMFPLRAVSWMSLVLKLLVTKQIYHGSWRSNNRLQSPSTRPTRTWH